MQDAGIPWRTVSSGRKDVRVLLHRRDLRAASSALSLAGHAVSPAARICTPRPQIALDGQSAAERPQGGGAWQLVRREEPAGTTLAEFIDGHTAPVRIQTRSGVYAEVHLPSSMSAFAENLSSAGHLGTALDTGRRVCMCYPVVNFQPPTGSWPRQLVTCTHDRMEVVALPPHRNREIWRRIGIPEDVVALKLVGDSRNRAGFWLFSRRHFVRVIGLQHGEGIVAGTCCQSLEQLLVVSGVSAVEAELRANYEALEGEIEAPGRLRIRRDAWCAERAGTLFNEGGGVFVSHEGGLASKITLRLPSGGEEVWQVLEWAFDPFSVTSTQVASVAAPSDSSRQPPKADASSGGSASSKSSGSDSSGSHPKDKKLRKQRSRSSSSRSQKRLKPRHRSSSQARRRASLVSAGAAVPPPLDLPNVTPTNLAPLPTQGLKGDHGKVPYSDVVILITMASSRHLVSLFGPRCMCSDSCAGPPHCAKHSCAVPPGSLELGSQIPILIPVSHGQQCRRPRS